LAKIHLVVGPVGAGKSTFALQLCEDNKAVHLSLDEWMTGLFKDDRPEHDVIPWYLERSQRCIDQIWDTTQRLLRQDTNVVLEIGLIQKQQRNDFYQRVDTDGFDLKIHVLDADKELRRQRVERRNQEQGATFSMEVSPEVFELANSMWQAFSAEECDGRDVTFITVEQEAVFA